MSEEAKRSRKSESFRERKQSCNLLPFPTPQVFSSPWAFQLPPALPCIRRVFAHSICSRFSAIPFRVQRFRRRRDQLRYSVTLPCRPRSRPNTPPFRLTTTTYRLSYFRSCPLTSSMRNSTPYQHTTHPLHHDSSPSTRTFLARSTRILLRIDQQSTGGARSCRLSY